MQRREARRRGRWGRRSRRRRREVIRRGRWGRRGPTATASKLIHTTRFASLDTTRHMRLFGNTPIVWG